MYVVLHSPLMTHARGVHELCASGRLRHSGDHQPEDEYKCNKKKDPIQELIVGLLHTARWS